MTRAQRLLVTAVGAAIVCAITSSVALAQGFLGPGHSSTEFADASASWFPDANNPYFVDLTVSRSTFVFRPTENSGGTPIIQRGTMLIIFVEGASFFGSDCFMIPDTDFVVSTDVQSAALNATVNANNRCQGFGQSLQDIAAGKPGGGPPPVVGFQFPLTVSASWSGNGATVAIVSDARESCAGFSLEGHISDSSARGTATGLVSMPGLTVTTPSTDQAGMDEGALVTDTQGVPPLSCFGI